MNVKKDSANIFSVSKGRTRLLYNANFLIIFQVILKVRYIYDLITNVGRETLGGKLAGVSWVA